MLSLVALVIRVRSQRAYSGAELFLSFRAASMTRQLLVTAIPQSEKSRNHFGELSRLEWAALNQCGKVSKRQRCVRKAGNKTLRFLYTM